MVPSADREVIFELIFDLVRLLRDIDVSAKANGVGERERCCFLLAVEIENARLRFAGPPRRGADHW